MSRISGWAAHVVEQLDNNRLIRPRALYKGPPLRAARPIAERGYKRARPNRARSGRARSWERG